MLKGIILNGEAVSVAGQKLSDIFKDENVVVIMNEDKTEIYGWVGKKSNPRDRFMAARLANNLRWKYFGGAAPVIQKNDEIEEKVKAYGDSIEFDIPSEAIKEILGI